MPEEDITALKLKRLLHILLLVSLSDLIIHRIETEGPISFHDFMDMALYYPELGYYNSGENKIGKNGDFFTSPYTSSLFGEMIALQIEEMWRLLGKKEFRILEYGAGTGLLCRDILNQCRNNPELYEKLQYCIIEKSEAMQEKEKKILDGPVSWYSSIGEIPEFTGCILSNELIDNFPVHQVIMQKELMEVFVDHHNGFVETLQPASTALKDYLDQLNILLPKGFRTEINLQAIEWIKEISSALQKGFVLTIDYGYPSSGFYHEGRREGTIVCYHKHRVNFSPYHNIGLQDITAHVNFSALHHWGSKNGLEYGGFTNQAYFLMGLGLSSHALERKMNGKEKEMMPILLGDMGRKLKVLVQQKAVNGHQLSGLRFAQQLI